MTLDNVLEDLFEKNPDLSEKEAIAKLRTMKDPKTKRRWKISSIRNRVRLFLKNKTRVVSNDVDPAAVKDPITQVIEKKSKRADPFESNESTKISKQSDDNEPSPMKGDIEKQIYQLKTDFIDIVRDLKSGMVGISDNVNSLKQEIRTIKKDTATYAPVIEYDDLKLNTNLIDRIQDEMVDQDIRDESKYIEGVLNKNKDSISICEKYDKLRHNAKSSKHGIHVLFENDKLVIKDIKIGKFGLNKKSLLIGGAVGGAIAALITYVVCTILLVAETVV